MSEALSWKEMKARMKAEGESVETLEKTLEETGERPDLLLRLARAYGRDGRYILSLNCYERLTELGDESAEAERRHIARLVGDFPAPDPNRPKA